MQNNTQKSASAVITPEDIRQLAENVQDLETAIGRDILHAQRNDDDVGCMVQNILADIEVLLVNNFGNKYFPDHFSATSLDTHGFPDDEEPAMRKYYANAGF